MDLLTGTVQPYHWGDRSAIASIQGRPPSREPEAELWFGAHPIAPSRLVGTECSLLNAIDERPKTMLGDDVAQRFGRFPFLLKILAAAEPLSIQAHPSREVAAAGFERESVAGIPLAAPHRTYRDDNHKPELLCALTRFEAASGFRDPVATVATLEHVARIGHTATTVSDVGMGADLVAELARRLTSSQSAEQSIADALRWLFHLSADETRSIAGLVVAGSAGAAGSAEGPSPTLRWVGELHRRHPFDVGIVVSLLLNHVVLEPGDAMFLGAGNLHAYLRGVGVELMANSDNVVRGGLTEKHVDVDELLSIVDTRPGPPPVERPAVEDHRYTSPVPEFSLTRLVGERPATERRFEPVGPEIVLVTNGHADLGPVGPGCSADAGRLRVESGSAAFVAPGDGTYEIYLGRGATAWRATVGDP